MNEYTGLFIWQLAQVLGYEGEKDLAEHSILLLVDFDANRFFPVYIGKSLELPDFDISWIWTQATDHLIKHVIAQEYKKEAELFFSEHASRRKYEKKRVHDSLNYASIFSSGPKWTHCIQKLFESKESIREIAEKVRSSADIHTSSNMVQLDIPDFQQPSDPHLMSFFLVIEVDAIRKSLESLRYLARHDQLTGLYNRHMMAELVRDEPSIVIILDIDKFKNINDEYGHDIGDTALCTLANRLEVIFNRHNDDMVFRLGGDEFLIVMKNISEDHAVRRIQQLCEPIKFTTDGADANIVTFTVSVGYSICTNDFKASMKEADQALYKVKKNGRNSWAKAEMNVD